MSSYRITSTTDGRFLSQIFAEPFPILLEDWVFNPDKLPVQLSEKLWRFSNTNYSIDAERI